MRSLLYLSVVVLFLALSGCNTTERIVEFEPNAVRSVQPANVDLPALQSRYGNVDGVFLTYDQTLEHNVSIAFTSTIPHWKFYHIVDRSRVVFNPEAYDLTTFRLELPANSRLERAALRVETTGASTAAYTERDLIQEPGPEGQTIYTLNYSNVTPGTIIHESYEVIRNDLERNPPLLHDIPLQYDIPTESLNFQYIYPIWWQVQVKNLSVNQPLNFERIEDTERRKIILRYADQDVPAFATSAEGPYFKQSAPYFQLHVTNMSMGSALRYRAAEDWTEFARDYRRFAVDADERPSRSLTKTADQLTGFLTTDRDRVEAILNYVSDNIQVHEESKTRNLDVVLSRREGDAFMVTSLTQAMLSAANIDAEFLLIHPAFEGFFDPNFFAEVQLNEPALGVFIDGEQYYVLPGRQQSLTETVPAYYAGQPAMVITAEGFGGFTEILSDQATAPMPIAIADRGTLGTDTEQNLPVEQTQPQQDPVTPPTAGQTPSSQQQTDTLQVEATNTGSSGGTLTQPVSPPGGGVVGSPIGNQPASNTPPPVQQPAVVEVTDPATDPNALPEWVGSIKRSLGGWTWIVASRTTLPEAEEVANTYLELYRQGLRVDVLAGQSNGVTRYRIAVGQYSSRPLAESDRARLGAMLPSDAWLLQIEPNM